MPVYIRKNVCYTPTSIDRMSDEEDDDYLLDPDQLKDVLPQPYRMINKLLTKIFEDAWEIIEQKEQKRLAEERKIRPPKYDTPKKLPIISEATALASSENGKYLFAGLPNGLAAVDTSNNQILHQWEEDRAEIVSIQTYNFAPNALLLVTMDDMAVARLFFFSFDCLMPIKVLNELESAKLLANRCEASTDGDYVGIVFENPSNKEVWFDAYKTPRETWVSELEAVDEKIQKLKKEAQAALDEKEELAAMDNTTEIAAPAEETEEKTAESPRTPSPPPFNVMAAQNAKFTPPTLVLRVKPPVSYSANTQGTIHSACSKVDATGVTLGMGQTHIMSAAHLESRDTTFQHMHARLIKYMTSEEERAKSREREVMTATFHFCNPGRTLLTGLEPIEQLDTPSCVSLWWKGSNHVLHFSLLNKPTTGGKDGVEHKPEVVWPFSSNITCSAISKCTSHIAIGLENGNVVVWDRYIGLQRGVSNMNERENPGSVQMLRFLDPCLYPTPGIDSIDYPPYPQRRGCYLVAQYTDSTQYLYDVGQNVQDLPICISELPDSDDDIQTLLESVPDLPELCLMVQKNGTLYLKDVLTGVRVCHITLPNPHQIQSPWEPILAFGARGQFLYVKGIGEESEDAEDGTSTSGVFLFPLRSFRTLDQYWVKTREPAKLLVRATVEDRLDALMKERLAQQALRKVRLQLRWGMLRSDLAVIQNAREVPVTSTRPFMTPSSCRSVPVDILTNFKPSTSNLTECGY